MARFNKTQVALEMERTGIIPIFYHPDPQRGHEILQACYKAGIRVVEFTNRGDYAHETFSQLTRIASEHYPDLILGAGSIVDAGTASLYMQGGANFIVSPVLNPDMGKVCNRRKVPWIPGCATVSEVSYAEELGATVVKIYPAAQLGGPAFVKAIKGPCPWSDLMVTGGVSLSEESITAWVEAGVFCMGVGSDLFRPNKDGHLDYPSITQKLSRSLELGRKLKKD